MRKIHRLLVLIIIALGLSMAVTGVLLKFTKIATDYFTFIDLPLTRYLHSQLSTYFAIALLLMIITGAWMYFYPAYRRRKAKKNVTDQPPK